MGLSGSSCDDENDCQLDKTEEDCEKDSEINHKDCEKDSEIIHKSLTIEDDDNTIKNLVTDIYWSNLILNIVLIIFIVLVIIILLIDLYSYFNKRQFYNNSFISKN
jgi:hypothetical protein